LGFDTVVFADRASLAALSCLSRLRSEREAGRQTLIVPIVDADGAEVVSASGLASVQHFDEVEAAGEHGDPSAPWRERLSIVIRRLGVRHVMAPLGILGAPQAIDYFTVLRAALHVDKGRDLLFFEERPHCLVPEAVPLRLSDLGIRLPPVSVLRAPRGRTAFTMRLMMGLTPPLFGGLGERWRLSRSLKQAFKEAADWDPHRALGPKLQPVTEPWRDADSAHLLELAGALGEGARFGTAKTLKRRMSRHAASSGSRAPFERYWLSLPGAPDSDPATDSY
jgi:hypothetical protein